MAYASQIEIPNHRLERKVLDQPYLPKMDGLRAISIFMVFLGHFFWSGLTPQSKLPAALTSTFSGGLGVTIFFVISGYLITSILLTYSDALTPKNAAKKFYWRRALRLFPIFYLCIAVTAALNLGGMRQTWWINALYLMNFKVARDSAWNGSSHFWSLCVEEQFYLLWFLIVVLIPRRFLLAVIMFFIIIAPVYRLLMCALGTTHFVDVLLPGTMDSMATGALISHAVNLSPSARLWRQFVKIRTPLLSLSLLAIIAIQATPAESVRRVILRSAMDIFAACLVSASLEQVSDWRFNWLGGNMIRHLGKISYGLYVYHFFLPPVIDAHLNFNWVHSYTGALLTRFAVLAAITVAIAEVSWRLIEKPILKLKRLV